jgi:hypothetical protein
MLDLISAEPEGSVADYLLHHVTVTITVTVNANTTSKERRSGDRKNIERE